MHGRQVEDYITEGIDRFGHGMYSEALMLFDRAVSRDPGSPGLGTAVRPHLATWVILMPLSIPAIRRLPQTPVTSKRGVTVGGFLGISAAIPRPLTPATRLSPCRPDFAEAWHTRGWVLMNLGRDLEALDSCDRATTLSPDDVEAWNMRGNVLMSLGLYVDALDSYDRVIAISTDLPGAWFNRANILAQTRAAYRGSCLV